MRNEPLLIAYVPVLHSGYEQFLGSYPNSTLYLIGSDILEKEFNYLFRKDIRGLNPETMQKALHACGYCKDIQILDYKALSQVLLTETPIVMPDEDVSKELAAKHFPTKEVLFEKYFLRWDKDNSVQGQTVRPDEIVSVNEIDSDIMRQLFLAKEKSPNQYIQVAAGAVRNGTFLKDSLGDMVEAASHEPTHYHLFAEGDPRTNFKKGVNIEASTSHHAEARLIARAAKLGTPLSGCDMYVTTFPCPPCALHMAASGIKRCFYSSGYSVLEGERILHSAGIKIIRISLKNPVTVP
ncbi:MAG: deoxycytidylate deaminase [Patescibacteria group bacterium]|jgi:dCMP deaminase|nr:deoxycytidylate deaminase [Patescibacteria group bacterium]